MVANLFKGIKQIRELADNRSFIVDLRVKKIIKWFESLSQNTLTEPYLSFLEPNLEFHLLENETDYKTVRILFDFEFRPKNADEDKEYFVDCKMDKSKLQKVASELKKELEPYPQREIQ